MWRKIQMELAAWYRRDDRKPLIIRGARQVGKSTLVQLAAEQLGLRLLTVNLEEPTPLAAPLARGDIDEVVLSLDLHFDVDLRKNSCLLFFDEIQARPEVIALLRYFYEKYPQIAVVAAGSLLDFELSAPGFSMPVGRTEFLHLGPMNFEEFLAATGQQRLLNYLQTYSLADEFNETAHLKLSEYLRHYLLVGGMPAVVKHWAETADLNEVFRLKSNLTTAFALDFHKYRGKVDTGLLTRLYTALPAMVGRKIKYSEMAPDVRVEKTKHALQQLYLARIAYGVNHTSAQGLPLAATQNPKVAKPLCLDVGLMLSQLGLSPSAVLESRDITLINEGQLAEQFIGQHLLYSAPVYREPALYYWVREGRSNAELDFVTDCAGRICAVEVKSGKGSALRSLHQFMMFHPQAIAVRFNGEKPVCSKIDVKLPNGSAAYKLLSLPHYLVTRLPQLVEQL